MNENRTLAFSKMNGLGNDFIVIDARTEELALTLAQVQWLASRGNETTRGCDQVLVIHKPRQGGSVFMQIFNADGGEVEACGNGARAVAGYLNKKDTGQTRPVIETLGGLLTTRQVGRDDFSVDMGVPKFDWQDIPLRQLVEDTARIELHADLPPAFLVNVGNPHAVFFVNSQQEAQDYAASHGEILEHHQLFPQRANINFAYTAFLEVGVMLYTWERGVGLTQACGTGACATAIAAITLYRAPSSTNIIQQGGLIAVYWDGKGSVEMHGEIEFNFDAKVNL